MRHSPYLPIPATIDHIVEETPTIKTFGLRPEKPIAFQASASSAMNSSWSVGLTSTQEPTGALDTMGWLSAARVGALAVIGLAAPGAELALLRLLRHKAFHGTGLRRRLNPASVADSLAT